MKTENQFQYLTLYRRLWNEKLIAESAAFPGMAEVYTDKTDTSSKEKAAVAYLCHVVVLDLTQKFQFVLIDYGRSYLWHFVYVKPQMGKKDIVEV